MVVDLPRGPETGEQRKRVPPGRDLRREAPSGARECPALKDSSCPQENMTTGERRRCYHACRRVVVCHRAVPQGGASARRVFLFLHPGLLP